VQNETKPSFGRDNIPSNFSQKEFQPSIQFMFPEKLPDMRLKRSSAKSNSGVTDQSMSKAS
jgi:hypothetical protein